MEHNTSKSMPGYSFAQASDPTPFGSQKTDAPRQMESNFGSIFVNENIFNLFGAKYLKVSLKRGWRAFPGSRVVVDDL